jgi:hypothetical protein
MNQGGGMTSCPRGETRLEQKTNRFKYWFMFFSKELSHFINALLQSGGIFGT